jgi:hypothetical protein
MPPGSCKEMSSLSPCPFWAKPITHVGLFHITTVRKCVCVPIHMQLCSTGFPGGFRVTAFQARFTALMVSRRDGACASLRHLEERNLTSTSPKLSRSTVSTSHPRPIGRFERTDRSFALCRPFSCALVGRDSHDYYDGSVTLGLAPHRPSHGASSRNVLARLRCPVRLLECAHCTSPTGQGVAWKKVDPRHTDGVGCTDVLPTGVSSTAGN